MDLDPEIYGMPICNGRFLVDDYGDQYIDISFVDGLTSGAANHHIVCASQVGKVISIADDPLDANYDCFSGSAFPGELTLEKNWTIDGAANLIVTNIEELEQLMSKAVCLDPPSASKDRFCAAQRQIELLHGVR